MAASVAARSGQRPWPRRCHRLLIGRPHLWGLAVAGEAGVGAVLDLYRREIDRVMALGGWDSLAAITADALDGRANLARATA